MSAEKELWLPPQVRRRIDQQREQDDLRKKKHYFAWTGFKDKTLWDWLQLLAALAIPVAVAVGTLWFTAAQSQASDRANAQQHQTDLQIANDQQQETALQNYLDRMSGLLLNNNLRASKPEDEVRNIARALTLTILPQLNGDRKGKVVRFLYESDLILLPTYPYNIYNQGKLVSSVTLPTTIVGLDGANLEGANLEHADLEGANLEDVDLQNANLSSAILNGADLYGATLRKATLTKADLTDAYLTKADLTNAQGTTPEQLGKAKSLQDAIMPDGSKHP